MTRGYLLYGQIIYISLFAQHQINRYWHWTRSTKQPDTRSLSFSFHGSTFLSRPGPSHYRRFTITLSHTTLGRTPLDESLVRRRYLKTSIWQHTTLTSDGHPCHRRHSNPQSQQVSGSRPTPETVRGSAVPVLSHKKGVHYVPSYFINTDLCYPPIYYKGEESKDNQTYGSCLVYGKEDK